MNKCELAVNSPVCGSYLGFSDVDGLGWEAVLRQTFDLTINAEYSTKYWLLLLLYIIFVST